MRALQFYILRCYCIQVSLNLNSGLYAYLSLIGSLCTIVTVLLEVRALDLGYSSLKIGRDRGGSPSILVIPVCSTNLPNRCFTVAIPRLTRSHINATSAIGPSSLRKTSAATSKHTMCSAQRRCRFVKVNSTSASIRLASML